MAVSRCVLGARLSVIAQASDDARLPKRRSARVLIRNDAHDSLTRFERRYAGNQSAKQKIVGNASANQHQTLLEQFITTSNNGVV